MHTVTNVYCVQSGLQAQIGELKQQILSLEDALSNRDKTFETQSQLQHSVQVFFSFPPYLRFLPTL
jgi:hypothetical protein